MPWCNRHAVEFFHKCKACAAKAPFKALEPEPEPPTLVGYRHDGTDAKTTQRIEPLLRHFRDDSACPPGAAGVWGQYLALADLLCDATPRSPERTQALQRLLESRDWACRALKDQAVDHGVR